MRVSRLFGVTRRDAPTDELISHQLLLRAGFIQQLATGIFSFLPIGWRTERKVRQILREEMDAIGGEELSMPVVHPGELWKRTGRWQSIDETLLRFQDRRGRDMVLALSHEEVVADLTVANVSSYRDLPRIVYQIQTKFRDEPRSRGGLLRTREFTMKDAYSLDRDRGGLEEAYLAHFQAYFRMAARAGIPVVAVLGDTGVMGGHLAHEFTYLTEVGEDTLALCQQCGYAANLEIAESRLPEPETEAMAELQEVETPNASTVAELSRQLGVEPGRVAKSVAYMVELRRDDPWRLVLALVAGDAEVNVTRLLHALGAIDLRPASPEELAAAGGVGGYMSPHGLLPGAALVVADEAVARRRNLVTGANREGWHLLNFNLERDTHPDQVTRLAAAGAGDPCVNCGGPLTIRRGIEFGNIFQLGSDYSRSVGAFFTDEDGETRPVVMGSYGIGVGRMLACIAEEYHDERGLTLPLAVAPYEVYLVAVGSEEEVVRQADEVYSELAAGGTEVLYDDREVSPGVKFADADLRGIPLRVTVSPRNLKRGEVELKRRSGEPRTVARAETLGQVLSELATIRAEELARAEEQLAAVPGLVARIFPGDG